MSFVDERDCGFGPVLWPVQGQRQFQVALGVLVVLALALASVSGVVLFDSALAPTTQSLIDTSFAGSLQTWTAPN